MLTPGRYVVVPSCTGCLSGEAHDKAHSAVGTKDGRNASETRDGQGAGGGAGITGEGEGAAASEEQKREEGGHGDKNVEESDEGNEDESTRSSASSFDRPDVLEALGDMFNGLDADCDGVLSREEVK